jgi:hypothetical protein
MKKIYLSVLAAAVAVTACDKSETINVENGKQQEVAFSPVNQPATKAPIETAAFPDDNTIYVSASNNKAKFFEAKTFKKSGAVWKNYDESATAFSPIYWPLGGTGSFDFLAYSTTLAATAVWGDGGVPNDVAGKVVITYPDNYGTAGVTKKTQDDLLYATTSSSSRSTALPIDFKHALAWVNFKVKSNINVNIKSIELVNVFTEGTFTIDQTSNTPQTSWTAGAKGDKAILSYTDESTLNVVASFNIDGSAGHEPGSDHAFGDMGILLPAQPIPNFKITYSLDGATDLVYVCNNVRGTWENGKKYTYKIDITFNEITLAPTVVSYDEVTDMPINL